MSGSNNNPGSDQFSLVSLEKSQQAANSYRLKKPSIPSATAKPKKASRHCNGKPITCLCAANNASKSRNALTACGNNYKSKAKANEKPPNSAELMAFAN